MAAAAGPAAAQQRPQALLILDASGSMEQPASPGGGTRLDAAKAAVADLLVGLPQGAPVGLRVFGARGGPTRAASCRDSRLEVPVGPLDRAALRARVDALRGKGRTPIGRSLLAAPKDLGSAGGSVVLVTDGQDSCAPPDPCEAARQIVAQGLDLTVSIVGLQVDAKSRRQLRCIARAGHGTYVDAADPDQLRRELTASFARAFRSYAPSGTPVQGGAGASAATRLREGLFRDTLRSGTQRWYAVDVRRGQRLWASSSLVLRHGGSVAGFRIELHAPDGRSVADAQEAVGLNDVNGLTRTVAARTPGPVGVSAELPPGTYRVRVSLAATPELVEGPVELGIQVLDPGERPSLLRTPGRLAPPPRRAPAPAGGSRGGRAAAGRGGDSAATLGGAGAGGLIFGAVIAFVLARRRRAA